MDIRVFTVGPFAENTYLLIEGKEALLVDPGFYEDSEFESFEAALNDSGAELEAVILTHAHVDHVLGLKGVIANHDVPIYLSDRDRYLWENYPSQARMFGFNVSGIDKEPRPIEDGKIWQIGNFSFDVRYTPGHAPDHVVLYSEKEGAVIAGDTLFKQGIGRTDLYKGDFNTLEKSIREQLYTLPGETEIFPGHGPETTVAYEKKNNPFVRD